MNSETVLGIDFGTTNSVCAILSGGDPEVLENAEGDRVTPSVVYYTKDHEQNRPLVGESAQNKAQDNPERVIQSIKRKMGDQETITVDGEEHRVEEVASTIIRKVRTDAAEKLGVDRDELTKAVITTPAYWESDRKQAVIQAAEMAGFDSVRTIKEPASAAIAYGRFEPGLNKTVGVYDLGGGTFDFAIVDVKVGRDESEGSEYDVKAQSGDPQLGGDDWDQRIVDWIAQNFEQETGVNPLEPHHTDDEQFAHEVRKERIRAKARSAKESLSNRATTEVDIRIPFLMEIGGESVDIDTTLSQTQFESMTEDLVEATRNPIYTAVKDAKQEIDSFTGIHDIDDVILVGGSTRMPQVNEFVKSVFQTDPKSRVNPDEAVAAGAAIKANRDDILLLEVTPLSLGIGIKGDRFKRMINRNERLPARTTEVFTTSSEGATAVRIPIYQGERDIASENRHLKTLIIQGMAPGSRHSAHIEVTFEVQQNGLINVHAVENTRNKSVSVELEGENRLPDEYIQERVEEAREMEEMDRRRQKVIEAQNEARKALQEAERLLKEFPHVFEEDEDEHVKKHINNVRQIRQDNTATLGELREATENLNEWVLEIGDRIRRTGAQNRTGPAPGPDTEPAEVESADPGGVRTPGPGQTASNATQGGTGELNATESETEVEVTTDTTDSQDVTASPSESENDPEAFDTPVSDDTTTVTGDDDGEPAGGTVDNSDSSETAVGEGNSQPDTDPDDTSDAADSGTETEPTDDAGLPGIGGEKPSSTSSPASPDTDSEEIVTPDGDDDSDEFSRDEDSEEQQSDDRPMEFDDDGEDPIGDGLDPRWNDEGGDSEDSDKGPASSFSKEGTDTPSTDTEPEGTGGQEDTTSSGGDNDLLGLTDGADSDTPVETEDSSTPETDSESVSDEDAEGDDTASDDGPKLGDDPEAIEPDTPASEDDETDDDDDNEPEGEQGSLDFSYT